MAAVLRVCVECGRPSDQSRCPDHRRKPWSTSRRKQQLGLSGGKWDGIRRRVLDRDMGTCYLCDRNDPPADEVDHLVPVAEGGSNELTNCASVHAACHRDRHADPERWQGRVEDALQTLREWSP